MANEERDFAPFVTELSRAMDALGGGRVFLVLDQVSIDRTLELANDLAAKDSRYSVVWAPENRTVVDAYLNGFRAALAGGFDWIIEMDAGLSHDPSALRFFLEALESGQECVFGSRFVPGGSMRDSPIQRIALSRGGSLAARLLLGSRVCDMTSGFEAFRRDVVENLVAFPLRSQAHFYQTEVRHLARRRKWVEIPINYRAPSPSVRGASVHNAVRTLLYYTWLRVIGRSPEI
jgi:dolichol-phosphate mannosyltransferase